MYDRQDYYHQKAKQQGYRARSSYKLIEIQNKYRIIKKNDTVLDIGCAPGSWLQVVRKLTHNKIVGIDLVKIKKIKDVIFIQGDIEDKEVQKQLKEKFNVIISDIAPKTSGNKELDQYKSYTLTKTSFNIAKKLLKKDGNFLAKTFQSQDTEELVKEIRKHFSSVKRYVPKATRQSSKEIYIIAKGFKSDTDKK